jgi:hypothetical protein
LRFFFEDLFMGEIFASLIQSRSIRGSTKIREGREIQGIYREVYGRYEEIWERYREMFGRYMEIQGRFRERYR